MPIKPPRGALRKDSFPHIRVEGSVPRMMWGALVALLPAVLSSLFLFRFDGFRILTVAVASAVLGEMGAQKLFKRPVRLYDGSAVMIGVLLSLLLPPSLPSWMIAIASLFAVIAGKEIFGGLGENPFNPALVGVAFVLASFPETRDLFVLTSSTPGLWIHSLTLLVGAAILLLKRMISWDIPLTYLGSVAIFTLALGQGWETFLYANFFLAAFFLVTDPVTSPLTRPGRRWFAFGAGLLAITVRQWSSVTEGVTYGILLMNGLSPRLDEWFRPHR